jgi:hypothetical protein
VGRWYWKSGGLKNHNGVPWEEQNINTCPENFLWEENKTSILTVAPGLYEVRCGIYSERFRPKFEVMVNGMRCIEGIKREENDQDIYKKSKELLHHDIVNHSNLKFRALSTLTKAETE